MGEDSGGKGSVGRRPWGEERGEREWDVGREEWGEGTGQWRKGSWEEDQKDGHWPPKTYDGPSQRIYI